uniref:Uncharacterized protein n=1 Tax=Trichuris muris TaxID=70415 RepID=A0A5S6QQ00_TRIMR
MGPEGSGSTQRGPLDTLRIGSTLRESTTVNGGDSAQSFLNSKTPSAGQNCCTARNYPIEEDEIIRRNK